MNELNEDIADNSTQIFLSDDTVIIVAPNAKSENKGTCFKPKDKNGETNADVAQKYYDAMLNKDSEDIKEQNIINIALTRNDLVNCISGLREILMGPYSIPNATGELSVLTGSTWQELEATLDKLCALHGEYFTENNEQ